MNVPELSEVPCLAVCVIGLSALNIYTLQMMFLEHSISSQYQSAVSPKFRNLILVSTILLQGGANAGHTIYNSEGKKFALHLVPSGILHEGTLCVVGNGAVIHVPGFFEEIDGLESNGVSCDGRILVSDRAHLLFDLHQVVDGLREAELENSFIGTTKRGIGPCYSSKVTRNGLRVCDLRNMDTFGDKLDVLFKDAASRFQGFEYSKSMLKQEVERYKRFAERLEPFIADTVHVLNESIQHKKKILVEGGQATMLDIDFGTYPFVTSSSPSAGGICTGLGIAPRVIGDLIGVVG
jgi:adenylosuccinate synthase